MWVSVGILFISRVSSEIKKEIYSLKGLERVKKIEDTRPSPFFSSQIIHHRSSVESGRISGVLDRLTLAEHIPLCRSWSQLVIRLVQLRCN